MKTEIRSFELRAAADEDFVLEGIAVSYDVLSQDLGGFRERIMPGAFARSLKSGDDCKCLFNHDPSLILGRRQSGTLQLHDETDGLKFRVQLDRNNSAHQNLYSSVKRGDVNEMSFAFVVASGGDAFDEVTQDGKRFVRRTVRDADLRDVSVVTYPAYNAKGSTNVSARTEHTGTQLLSTGTLDANNRRRAEEIGRMIAADHTADVAKAMAAASKPTTPAEIDAYNRARCEEVGRIVSEDRRKGEI